MICISHNIIVPIDNIHFGLEQTSSNGLYNYFVLLRLFEILYKIEYYLYLTLYKCVSS